MIQKLVAVERDSGWHSQVVFVGAGAVSPLYVATRWQRWTASAVSRHRESNDGFGLSFVLLLPLFPFISSLSSAARSSNLHKLQVSSVSCRVNLWKGLFLAMVQRAKKSFWVRTKFLCRRVQSEGRHYFFAWLKKVLSYPKPHISVLPLPTYSTKCHLEKKKISYNVAAKLLPRECACWEPGAIWKQ